ncbi:MAG: hypothetical protein HY782_17410 [Chloroflexi bacterium]|nr:hypothetical protein [Chloroflexota bacterium]
MELLLISLLVVVILWFVLKPDWAPKPPDTAQWTEKASQASKQATAKARQASEQATAKAGQMYQGARGRIKFRSDTGDLAKQFKQWVSESALPKRVDLYNSLPASAEGFAIWLSGLGEQEQEQFTQKVAHFCGTLNFDLAWLTDPEINRDPDLKKAVEDAVLLYSLAAWRANNVQQDVTSFLAYRAWLANPNQHKAFGQKLHQALIKQGLVTVPPELYLAPEQERVEQALTAIRKVADESPAAFHLALREVSGATASAMPAAPAPAPATPAPTLAPTPAPTVPGSVA